MHEGGGEAVQDAAQRHNEGATAERMGAESAAAATEVLEHMVTGSSRDTGTEHGDEQWQRHGNRGG